VDSTRGKLYDVHTAMNELFRTIYSAANENRFSTVVPKIADLNNEENEADNLSREFGQVARKDLDNLGYGESDTSLPTSSRSLWSWRRSSCSGTTSG
jgi:hypothetical protein